MGAYNGCVRLLRVFMPTGRKKYLMTEEVPVNMHRALRHPYNLEKALVQ